MLVSYKWLQTYFKETLPEPRELGAILNTRAFEVEGIEVVGGDHSIDVDVQPNRAHDCLCHTGIAKEIGVLTGLKFEPTIVDGNRIDQPAVTKVSLEEGVACPRYISKQINGIVVAEAPQYIKERLTTLKQRSINSLVDIANYVMFEVGQPLHVFDADKITGDTIMVRLAQADETMITLDGTEVSFNGGEMVIADEAGILAIAGIKGGTRAEVTSETKNIILEAANFNASVIRRTSTQLGITTDASKRFERDITPSLAGSAMQRLTDLLLEHVATPDTQVHESVDVYPRPVGVYKTGVSLEEINTYLGTSLTDADVSGVLTRLGFSYENIAPHTAVVEKAVALVGAAPYKYGASVLYDAPNAFDCSSFVSYLYKEAGVSVPRVTVDQYVWGTEISKEELQPGDIVFCDIGSSPLGEDKKFYHKETVDFMKGTPMNVQVDHNGVYIGNGEVVHASSKAGNTVARESLETSQVFSHVIGYRRMATVGETRYVITVPDERLDIRIPADVIEEIGRVFGYEHIVPQPLTSPGVYVMNQEYSYLNQIRTQLQQLGFSEIMTSTFTETGDIEAEKAMASDKAFLRTNLRDAVERALVFNEKQIDLLGLDRIRLFEIGHVFTKNGEAIHLALGVSGKKSETLIKEVLAKLGFETSIANGVAEIVLNPETASGVEDVSITTKQDAVYKPFSSYPFIVRDIALWVPGTNRENELLESISKNAGPLLVGNRLFDVFEKDGRTSYAFRLVFQSFERTLTDVEINEIMERITKVFVDDCGFEVR